MLKISAHDRASARQVLRMPFFAGPAPKLQSAVFPSPSKNLTPNAVTRHSNFSNNLNQRPSNLKMVSNHVNNEPSINIRNLFSKTDLIEKGQILIEDNSPCSKKGYMSNPKPQLNLQHLKQHMPSGEAQPFFNAKGSNQKVSAISSVKFNS